jgi:hypothetical protein
VLAAAWRLRPWGKAILDHMKRLRDDQWFIPETLSYRRRAHRTVQPGGVDLKDADHQVDKIDGKYSTVGKERTIARSLESIRDHLAAIYRLETRL